MTKQKYKSPADFIVPLNMNGLQGRMMNLPPPKHHNKEILFIYGHHSSLERWWGLAQVLNKYGSVTIPDLPGFGGMDSFYKIGSKPTIDNLADYLASFIKLKYKRRRVTLVSMSFGFVIVTRMLQRYPDLAKKVALLVSVAGFANGDEFVFSRPRKAAYLALSTLFSHKLPSIFFKNVVLNPLLIKKLYAGTHNAKSKFAGLSPSDKKAMLDFEVYLWHINDPRTHMYTSAAFLNVNNCNVTVGLPLHHVSVAADQYFDAYTVEQHLKIIFPAVTTHSAKLDRHAPSLLADEKQASSMFPASLKRLLNS
jgi:pimeloyl-ACP methyl ester carboxylesterase